MKLSLIETGKSGLCVILYICPHRSNCIVLYCIALLYCVASRRVASSRYVALYYFVLFCIASHRSVLQCIVLLALYCTALHCIVLHYILSQTRLRRIEATDASLRPTRGDWTWNEPRHDKTSKWVCAQRRLRSALASDQSDQSLRCPHEESLGP